MLSIGRFARWLSTGQSLQKRIALLVLTVLVVGLGLFSLLGLQSVNESTRRILDERLTLAQVMANHLDETLKNVLVHLQGVNFNGELPSREQFSSTVSEVEIKLIKSGIVTRRIMLLDGQGKISQVEPENSGIIGLNMSVYPEVRQMLNTGLPTISGLVSSPLVEVPVVLISVPVFNRTGTVIGALTSVIDVEQSSNNAFSPAITVGKTGYTEIVDGNGIVIARTSPGSPPVQFELSDHPGRFAQLISQRKAIVGTCHRCHEIESTVGRQRDVLAFAPLTTTSWGVAIRQSEEEALAPTRQLEMKLLLLGTFLLVSTFFLVWVMLQGVVQPIKMLTAAAQKVAAGDFKAVIPVRRQDEIGQLNAAFYTMTRKLADSRAELVLRNEELSALNSMAVTVSQSLNLTDVLENAIQKVLEVTKKTAGSVFLRSDDGTSLEMKSYLGSLSPFQCREAGSAVATCACHQVLHNGQTLMVKDVSQCPMLGEDTVLKDDIGCFVSVPLKSKERTLGIMNIAGSDERSFTENDFKILDSIGYHIGLAIENSVLYEEARQKEKLRGDLLGRVINAQEDERRRIARELHDEYGQTLTGLIMSIESIESMALPQHSQLNEKLANAKSLLVRALEDMRRLTLDLRPSTLDDLGLVATTRSYVHSHLEPVGIKVSFDSKGLGRRLEPAVETTLFRIIQEAIRNIIRHAEAHNVRIHLEAGAGKIAAIVEDDGKGFDVESTFRYKIGSHSLGLLGIKERATLLGGTFSIKSKVGRGTILTVEIPLASVPADLELAATRRDEAGRS